MIGANGMHLCRSRRARDAEEHHGEQCRGWREIESGENKTAMPRTVSRSRPVCARAGATDADEPQRVLVLQSERCCAIAIASRRSRRPNGHTGVMR